MQANSSPSIVGFRPSGTLASRRYGAGREEPLLVCLRRWLGLW